MSKCPFVQERGMYLVMDNGKQDEKNKGNYGFNQSSPFALFISPAL